MDSLRNFSAMESPKANRKPFGEITNNVNHTPLKEDQAPKEEEALTPLANLKMLIRVASETTPDLPPKRELFREDSIGKVHYQHSITKNLTLGGAHQNRFCFYRFLTYLALKSCGDWRVIVSLCLF